MPLLHDNDDRWCEGKGSRRKGPGERCCRIAAGSGKELGIEYATHSRSVFETITSFLDERGVAYRTIHHEPAQTSEESARVRGVELSAGGKAILVKLDGEFKLFVFSAARKLDSKKIRSHFSAKKIRFATPEELHELTGLVPGSVPPFGRPVLPFDLFIDSSLSSNSTIAFNAGSLTDSIIMSADEYLKVANSMVFDFTL